jgi:hypothetical protein
VEQLGLKRLKSLKNCRKWGLILGARRRVARRSAAPIGGDRWRLAPGIGLAIAAAGDEFGWRQPNAGEKSRGNPGDLRQRGRFVCLWRLAKAAESLGFWAMVDRLARDRARAIATSISRSLSNAGATPPPVFERAPPRAP